MIPGQQGPAVMRPTSSAPLPAPAPGSAGPTRPLRPINATPGPRLLGMVQPKVQAPLSSAAMMKRPPPTAPLPLPPLALAPPGMPGALPTTMLPFSMLGPPGIPTRMPTTMMPHPGSLPGPIPGSIPGMSPLAFQNLKNTTVYVGKISEHVDDDFIQKLLGVCGQVTKWNRATDPTTQKLVAFGFCEFDSSEGVYRALKFMDGKTLADKDLLVKCDDKNKFSLEVWIRQQRKTHLENLKMAEGGKDVQKTEEELDQMIADANKEQQEKLEELIKERNDEYEKLAPDREKKEERDREREERRRKEKEEAERKEKEKKEKKDDASDVERRKRDSREEDERRRKLRRLRSHPRQRERETKRRERERAEAAEFVKLLREYERKEERRIRDYKDGLDQLKAPGEREKRRLIEKEVRDAKRLKPLSVSDDKERKRRMEKEREKDEDDALCEARELDEVEATRREDEDRVEDERRDEDARKARQMKKEEEERRLLRAKEEQAERDRLESLRRDREKRERAEQEKKVREAVAELSAPEPELSRQDAVSKPNAQQPLPTPSASPTMPVLPLLPTMPPGMIPPANMPPVNMQGMPPLGMPPVGMPTLSMPSMLSAGMLPAGMLPAGMPPVPMPMSTIMPVNAQPFVQEQQPPKHESPKPESPKQEPPKQEVQTKREASMASFSMTKKQPEAAQGVQSLFEAADEANKKPVPLQKLDNPSDKVNKQKELDVKSLIAQIPTAKREVFSYPIDWECVRSNNIIETKLKPWVRKKVIEYLGAEETTMIEFIIEKVESASRGGDGPDTILTELESFIDEEAEQFVLKMWRMIIFENLRVKKT